ncbi:prolyl oligopeptidase family serine peptidase [Mariniflexile sp.]|uniref:prolyl oligopeptidase family serine peptidase n=1 Tax=Mariniflexile sp. TaxID=1979402 RepID=UPI00356978C5
MKQLLYFILFNFLSIGTSLSQEKKHNPVNVPDEYLTQINVVYTRVNGWDGKMDLYTNPKAEAPTPIVINIHGGGWNHGEKESQTGFGSWFKNGYAVANVAYRLVHIAPAPAAIEDVRCALIYIIKNAKTLNIDTNKIVIMGASSGGHLALMAGLLGSDNRFDYNCSYDEPIKVTAIINKYGVSDLAPLATWKSAKNWLGTKYNDEHFVQSVSPIHYVNTQSPSVFIIHGDADPIVPYNQSTILYNALKAKGVKTEFITIQDGAHGKFSTEQNEMISKQLWEFLNNLGL